MYVFQICLPVAASIASDAAAEGAALIRGDRRRAFLHRRHRHEQAPVGVRHTAGDDRVQVILDLGLPGHRAGRRRPRRTPAHARRRSRRCRRTVRRAPRPAWSGRPRVGLDRPHQASGLRVERVDDAVAAADEHARLPTTEICEPDADTPGRPNAHFSFSFGTSAADMPAAAPAESGVFCALMPQPFHDGAGQRRRCATGRAVGGLRNDVERRPIGARRTAGHECGHGAALGRRSEAPCRRMVNELSEVSTCSGVMPRSASRVGMRGREPS